MRVDEPIVNKDRYYLCGEDELTGRNYEHRKDWIVGKLKQLDEVFSISICAYAVMHNHNEDQIGRVH
jgi:hypothetical protein